MATENWATKHRPEDLKRFYGQDSAREAVANFIDKDKIPSTILIHGPTGCGKTTLARIIAKSVNNSFEYDYHEEDLASTGNADKIREVINLSKLKPRKAYKFIVLDEAHTLTAKSSPMLLKTLEEPAKKTVWILLTNHPEKLDNALRGRTYQIALANPSNKDMLKILNRVAVQENLKLPEKDASIIINYSQNEPRTAITLLQKWADCGSIEKLISQISEAEDKTSLLLLYKIYSGKPDEATEIILGFSGGRYQLIQSALIHNKAFLSFYTGQTKYLSKNQKSVMERLKSFKVKRAMQVQYCLVNIRERITSVSMDNVSYIGEFYNLIYGAD